MGNLPVRAHGNGSLIVIFKKAKKLSTILTIRPHGLMQAAARPHGDISTCKWRCIKENKNTQGLESYA
jgi:hypothetical protein